MRVHGRGIELFRIGQHPALRLERLVFAFLESRALDLASSQSSTARLAAISPAHRLRARSSGSRSLSTRQRPGHRLAPDSRGTVEQLPLLRLVESAQSLALGVHQRQFRSELPQNPNRRRLIVHIDPALSVGLDFAPQDDLRALGIDPVRLEVALRSGSALKDACHHGPLRPMPHDIGRGLLPIISAKASTRIDFPAPVSPVSRFRPGPKTAIA